MTIITPIMENNDLVLLDKNTYKLMLDAFEQTKIFAMLKEADEDINNGIKGEPMDEVFARIKNKNGKV